MAQSPQPLDPSTPRPLSATDLTFGYDPGRPVVEGLTAQLAAGQICALIGPNAAGKSTLLRLLLGQLTPWSGSARICGLEAAALSPARRAAWASFVPQRGAAGFAFTVEQVVAMGRHVLPRDPAAIETALASCDLLADRARVYSRLSVGQQQRVLLARALAQAAGQGRVMMLDEPGSAMDLWHLHHTMQLLGQQAHAGLAVLVVLHDLNLAARYADTIWLMDAGRLVATGPWDQVLNPTVLEPVYRVRLQPLHPPGSDRPVFLVNAMDTLMK